MNGTKNLQVQLRPGEWTLSLTSRALGDVTEFTLPASEAPWPQEEVWVFATDNTMRQVQVKGINSIDPNQTRLPNNWKTLPAYLLHANKTLALNIIHRGGAKTGRDELQLHRHMWLDYDGDGYTLLDKLKGTIQQKSRLNVLPNIELGRVSVNQQPQFITQDDNGNTGVEIRRTQIALEAESRYEGNRSDIPISGWQQSLNTVNTTLHLPPGWRIFSIRGTDNVPRSWIQQWSLLDLFLVLIISLAAGQLFNWRWTGFAVLTLALTWHETGAPAYIWLNLLAAIALLRVLPAGRLKKILQSYRVLSLFALAFILLPYVINTVRISIYPQLETGRYSQTATNLQATGSVQQEEPEEIRDLSLATKAPAMEILSKQKNRFKKEDYSTFSANKKKADLKSIDPNSICLLYTSPSPRDRG